MAVMWLNLQVWGLFLQESILVPGFIPEHKIAEIQRAIDIVELISGYMPLKRVGTRYKALCPFHQEKTPSFHVSPERQIFKCFGCNVGGDVFKFVMLKERVEFPEAVRMLAERVGITVTTEGGVREERAPLYEANAWAAGFFHKSLKESPEAAHAREYLARRKISAQMIAKFQLGYAPNNYRAFLEAAAKSKVSAEVLERAGLLRRRSSDNEPGLQFRNRLIFPIRDGRGRVIAFGARALRDEDMPKYLNSPETPIFSKSRTLYGIGEAKEAILKQRRVAIMEGYTDVIMAHQFGIEWAVAVLGTALTQEHLRELKRYADEVVLVFDSDLAGQRAADKGLELFLAGDVKISIAVVPSGKDPYDFCRAEGAEPFRQLAAQARDAFAYKWAGVAKEYDAASSPAAQRRALEAMLGSIAKAPVLAREDLRLQRDLILGHMSRTLGIPEETLRAEFSRLRRPVGRSAAGTEQGAALPEPATRGRRWAAERELLTVLVCRPSRAEAAMKVLPPDRIQTAAFRRLYEAIAGNAVRQDGDIESIVLRMEEPELASLAVDLFERGERLSEARDPADTGPGPLEQMLVDAVTRIADMEEEEKLAAHRRAASENTSDAEAFRAFAEARAKRQGFLPPAARRQELPDT